MPFSQFSEYWDALQSKLKPGEAMESWSVAGRAMSTFYVVRIDPDYVDVRPQYGDERRVPRFEFERVFVDWPAYKAKKKLYRDLRFKQHLNYIVTLLHWVESGEGQDNGRR